MTEAQSRQLKRMRRLKAEGRCTDCGMLREGQSKWHCTNCLVKRRKARRKRGGHRKLGKRRWGRPQLVPG